MSLLMSFGAVLLFHEMSWMRIWTELSEFLRVFLPTLEDWMWDLVALFPDHRLSFYFVSVKLTLHRNYKLNFAPTLTLISFIIEMFMTTVQ